MYSLLYRVKSIITIHKVNILHDRQISHSNALYTLLLLQYTYTLRTLHMANSILEPYGPVNEGLLYANKTLV